MVQEVLGPRTVPFGAEADEPLQTRKKSPTTTEILKIILKLEEGRVPDRNATRWKFEGEKSGGEKEGPQRKSARG